MHSPHTAAALPAANNGSPTQSAPCPSIETMEPHDLTAIFPLMSEADYAALVADIRDKGQLEPVWTYAGKVIDGRHRLRACKELGVTPKTREWDGNGSLLEFVISLNLRRRQLKENQRAMVAARLMPMFTEEALQRMNVKGVVKSQPQANLPEGQARDQAGKCLNVSGRSVTHARRLLDRGIPALIAKVDTGQLAVSAAAKIAALPAEEQKRMLMLNRREIADAFRLARPAQPPEPAQTSTPAPAQLEKAEPPAQPAADPSPPPQEAERPTYRYPRAVRKRETEADERRDDAFIKAIYNGIWCDLRKCDEGLRLKVSVGNWYNELAELFRHPLFPDLLDRGVLVMRSDEQQL